MNDLPDAESRLVLLTGATGYVGGRLLTELEARGYGPRCVARHPEYLQPRVRPGTEVVQGDMMDLESLRAAMQGVSIAYYLVHSLGSGKEFEDEEIRAAGNFARAASEAGVQRIIYLGGLGSDTATSPHLRSRHEVGRILRESGVPTIEFRASIVIGSGSLSFELIRALVKKLPVMITPRWTRSLAQPIAIEDVIAYLVAAIDLDADGSRVYEIGGDDIVSYHDLMQEYCRQRGLRRVIVPVPILSTSLSSLWLGLITPVYARIGRKLISSLRYDTVVTDDSASQDFDIRPRGMREAIARALVNEDQAFAQTRWTDALSTRGPARNWGGVRFGSRIVDSRVVEVALPPEAAFAPIIRIGGDTGWYYGNWLWRTRGFLDLLVGGVGTRRGRRSPDQLAVGDALDFWRVEACDPPRLLRLTAEMKTPGRAWLQFEVDQTESGSRIRQTAIFDPTGLAGLVYWYALFPLHGLVFEGMLRGIAVAAISSAKSSGADPTTRRTQPPAARLTL